jgi:myo-inositol-1(or 4)-monophosphatase
MSASRDVELFFFAAREVTTQVRAVLDSTSDWAESGFRDGQYRVDLATDQVCVEVLSAAGFGVLSEESGRRGPQSARLVVVDPLDGSTNAARGVPWFATALCLVDERGPLASWVVNHADGDVFSAVRGHGARHNGRVITVNPPVDLADAFIGVSGLPTHHYGWGQFRALGAAALDISAVATGVLDGWCDMSTDAHGVWDYLAAVLICEEAGGVAADVEGRDLLVLDPSARRTPVVANRPALLSQLLAERNRSAR